MYSLLIIDDEADIRNGYARFFPWEQMGFEVVACAEDGVAALEILRRTLVDLVICDLVMPNMDGFSFIRQVNRLYPDVLIIVLSGYDSFEYARQLVSLKVFHYLLKSDKHHVLIEVLKKAHDELERRTGGIDYLVAAARQYVTENMTGATLNAASARMHVSPSHLSRTFKEKTGKNFYAYVLEQRMDRACELLAGSTLRIYQIALELGYSDVKSFNRVFKQRMCTTPKEYRLRKKGGSTL